jgi:hypothetical protein
MARFFNSKKGFIYSLEALIVITIVFFLLAYLFRYAPQTSQAEISVMKIYGIQALEYLENSGDLQKLVSEYNEAEIEKKLGTILPNSIKFETEICRKNCNAAGVPNKNNVIAVDYYISTYRDSYEGQRVRIWMWR